ncbi:hypothetical protein NY98_21030 [Xanthomonas citri pv. fuscans]|uniref:Uncharacterized protein n=1 Tax=Xanthomonas citri pv. fuscans TaxID=366649 RepID=A0AB34Q1G4_XANCI|nr:MULTISPECIES: hypothetical protein [Xanthomonas]ATB56687.1 hypothetical protein CKU38_00119 [Xanthomonas citri pv. fuscans]ATS65305.1 hypothetical protein XcfCFBP4885P_19505 [Xanthomonas citri pv. phaseoli var. fuscans]ATS73376.1 hypothetical protein XcfCFBP6166P_18945 [Xanthomonas citri pv. phaseoli var. fuscans]ATS76216.1 hypothetical protein XcfCFBP6975P_11065 [Xanthomonas citri pv. phaseoli var. fuscans]ATS78671.1 hypothetical protein XcfCFBP7767P_00495 [Xanthomonas citri pv. phaseoli v
MLHLHAFDALHATMRRKQGNSKHGKIANAPTRSGRCILQELDAPNFPAHLVIASAKDGLINAARGCVDPHR